MTQEERLDRLPTDRHIQYTTRQTFLGREWVARWRDDAGIRRFLPLGSVLPAQRPDWPCQHRPHRWPVPLTPEDQREARERGRRANALRNLRSNQYRKRLPQAD